jgi:hypothetical protein
VRLATEVRVNLTIAPSDFQWRDRRVLQHTL